MLASTLIWWALASGELSPIVLPDPALAALAMVLVRSSIASRSVVLPDAKGPTMAMHFGPVDLPPARFPMMFPPIIALIQERQPVLPTVA